MLSDDESTRTTFASNVPVAVRSNRFGNKLGMCADKGEWKVEASKSTTY